MTKPLDLEDIKKRIKAATPGPWAWEAYGEKENAYHIGVALDKNDKQLSGMVQTERYDEDADIFVEDVLWRESLGDQSGATVNYDDAEFIAHAREDIPALVAEVERLSDIIDKRDAILGLARELSVTMASSFEDAVRAIAHATVAADPSRLGHDAHDMIRRVLGEEG
jgi:hypothetical protein